MINIDITNVIPEEAMREKDSREEVEVDKRANINTNLTDTKEKDITVTNTENKDNIQPMKGNTEKDTQEKKKEEDIHDQIPLAGRHQLKDTNRPE